MKTSNIILRCMVVAAIILSLLPQYINAEPTDIVPATTGHNTVISFTSSDGSSNNGFTSVEYFDNFGRSEETVFVGITKNRKDMVAYKEYDMAGRIWREWQNAISPNNYSGSYVTKQDCSSAAISSNNDTKPYIYYVYEPSLLNRISAQYGAGNDWQSRNKHVKTEYYVNHPSSILYNCKKYAIEGNSEESIIIRMSSVNTIGQTQITEVTDEDGRKTLLFKDSQDRTILSRNVIQGNETADTYYIYDKLGKLQAVLPPELCNCSGTVLPTDMVNKYAYLYLYDERERLKAKKLPGADWIRYAYDGADRIIYSQDGLQRQRGIMAFYLYDVFGRECIFGIADGIIGSNSCISTIPYCTFTGTDNEWKGYTISGMQLNNPRLGKVCYYDNYLFLSIIPNSKLPSTVTTPNGGSSCATGLLTGSAVARMDSTFTTTFDYTVQRYDDRGRLNYTVTSNSLKGYDTENITLNHLGQPTERVLYHYVPNKQDITEYYSYTYDHAGRLLTTSHRINNASAKTISSNVYDELGRLETRNQNGGQWKTDYGYNIRGWQTKSENQLFKEYLYYNENHNSNNPQYGGNISAMDWQVNNQSQGSLRGYIFSYDNLSRLTTATYSGNGNYNTQYSYDKMGNVKTVRRYGLQDNNVYGLVDNLTYTYNGNQVIKVDDAVSGPTYAGAFHFKDASDASIEYEYDKNGNMTKDLNKKISQIKYNLLNLPSMVVFNKSNKYNITYDANGKKLSASYGLSMTKVEDSLGGKVGYANTTTDVIDEPVTGGHFRAPSIGGSVIGGSVISPDDKIEHGVLDSLIQGTIVREIAAQTYKYCGNVIYKNGAPTVYNGEGYVTFDKQNNPVYHYYMKDHLGNVRVVVDQSGTIEQVNHYYPFGALFGESTNGDKQRFKYNGKELDRIGGLDLYDYGARYSDAMRFTTIDPLAEKYYSVSPYVYCLNNPTIYVDPDGRSTWVKRNGDGIFEVIGGDLKDKDRNIYIYIQDHEGNYTIRGESIGQTATLMSFYNSDKEKWAGYINIQDQSGNKFLNYITGKNGPNLISYMFYARNNKKYDFKVTNGTNKAIPDINIYRGMPIMSEKNITYASARDIGNMAAGYIVAKNGIAWNTARKVFDLYQGSPEGPSTVSAEYYGYFVLGRNTTLQKLLNLIK